MSVEPSESMREAWTSWQGYVINGVFPLGRYLGSSDHSGVFLTKSLALTQSMARDASEVAIKLVPTNRALAELHLPRWRRAGRLPHPHLLRLLEWGGCQLEGLPYLYAVMEYADQTLAQLLQHRAMTDDEAREMLLPMLDALTFLHRRNLVQGQLKPANILVVADQVKLSSDTIRRVSDGPVSTDAPSVYDPPEARYGSTSTAGDIWALGVTLFEALTRRLPSGLREGREAVALPADFPLAFREVVAFCLSPNPEDRPSVTELVAWARGRSPEFVRAAPVRPAALVVPEAVAPEPVAPEPVVPEPVASEPAAPQAVAPHAVSPEPVSPEPTAPERAAPAPVAFESTKTTPRPVAPEPAPPQTAPPEAPSDAAWRALYTKVAPMLAPTLRAVLPVIIGLFLALIWTGVEKFRSHRTPTPPPTPVQAPAGAPASNPGTPSPASAGGAPASAVSTTRPNRSDGAAAPSALHEVIPDVARSARRSIRGHIKVSVRVIVDPDGSVFAAVADRTGPSKYFQRLAVEAAKKWTFPPADTESQRLMQVRFDFGRDGTSGHAVAVQ